VSRLYRPRPDELNAQQRTVYDDIVRGDRGADQSFDLVDDEGRLHGPFNAMVIAPHVGAALAQLGAALRFQGTLSGRAREIVILTVAAAKHSEFELYAHTRVGRRLGLTQDEIVDLTAGRPSATFDEAETAAQDLAIRLTMDGASVSTDDFERFRAQLGESGIVEISALVGYYAMLALQLDLFDVQPPD
jgi:4-carboxymuconolactone decarboxylase